VRFNKNPRIRPGAGCRVELVFMYYLSRFCRFSVLISVSVSVSICSVIYISRGNLDISIRPEARDDLRDVLRS